MMRKPKPGRVVAMGNQKGGVAKSTNTVHLAVALGELGLSVLVVDLDVNAGASSYLGAVPAPMGTLDVVLRRAQASDVVLRPDDMGGTWPKNVDLLAGSRALENLDAELAADPRSTFRDPLRCLVPLVRWASEHYAITLLDTAPNLSTLTRSAYLTADSMLISTVPDFPSWEGAQRAAGDIERARDENPRLELLGVILSNVDVRNGLATDYRSGLPDAMVALHFERPIRSSVALRRAWQRGMTLFEYEPLIQHAGSREIAQRVLNDYRCLAREVVARLRENAP